MSEELKPCPFCGGKAKVNYNIDLEPDGIVCNECKVIVRWPSLGMKKNETYGEAAARIAGAWNRRLEA